MPWEQRFSGSVVVKNSAGTDITVGGQDFTVKYQVLQDTDTGQYRYQQEITPKDYALCSLYGEEIKSTTDSILRNEIYPSTNADMSPGDHQDFLEQVYQDTLKDCQGFYDPSTLVVPASFDGHSGQLFSGNFFGGNDAAMSTLPAIVSAPLGRASRTTDSTRNC